MRNNKIRKHTNRALLISLALHIAVMLTVSPFLINHFNVEKESISADILKPDAEKRVKQRVSPPRSILVPQVSETETSTSAPASPTYVPEVSVPKAPVHADVIPDIVTHTDLPQLDAPSPVSNASSGEDGELAGPVVIKGQRRTGVGGPGRGGPGRGGPERAGYGTGKHLVSHGTGASDVGLATLDGMDAGLGIFDTDVVAGHGLIGQVYVPGGTIHQMPDFDHLTPIYTFITPNLDVPERDYTEGFPTPEMQSVIEDFAIRFRGELTIDTSGLYLFGLYADDGAKLYINGTLVVDNDGIHPAKGEQGGIMLTAGTHPVEIHYFQGPRQSIALRWYYQPPIGHYSERWSSIKWNRNWRSSIPGRIVPPEVIYRPGKQRVPDAFKKLQQRLKKIENNGKQ